MPSILFIDAPTSPEERIGAFSKIIDLSRDRPHLGILTLAAVARSKGWNTGVIDPYPFQWSDDEICRQVLEFNPDVIGISAHTLGIANGHRLARLLKQHRSAVPILVGGPHVTSAACSSLKEFPAYDIAVVGEAEETLVEMLQSFQPGTGFLNLSGVSGIAFRNEEGIPVQTPRRQYQLDLDRLPMPAWDLLPQYPFLYSPSLASGAGSRATGSLFTTRGCPWRCKFCDRGVFGDSLRKFSAKYVMEQILHLYHHYGVREIMFGDDTLLVDKDRMMELAEMMIAAKLDLRWECMSRVVDADAELFEKIKKAGCFEISYGIESADDKISQNIFKPINQKNIRRAIELTRNAGIRVRGYFIFGLPGETKATLATTSSFILSSGLDDVAIFSCTPYPGSALYETAEQYGHFEKTWNSMNNVKTVFVPHGLTADYIEKIRQKTMRRFYMNPRFLLAWGKRLFQEGGWRELRGRGGLYSRFLGHALREFASGLGRGA